MDFKTGDVVALKSGGTKMTVAAVKADRAICVWFNQREQYHEEKTAEFLIDTLKLLSVRRRPPQSVPQPVATPAALVEPTTD